MELDRKLIIQAESINEQNWAEGEACINTLMAYNHDLVEECLKKSQQSAFDGGKSLLEFMQEKPSNAVLVGNLTGIALGEIVLRVQRRGRDD